MSNFMYNTPDEAFPSDENQKNAEIKQYQINLAKHQINQELRPNSESNLMVLITAYQELQARRKYLFLLAESGKITEKDFKSEMAVLVSAFKIISNKINSELSRIEKIILQ